MGEKWPKESGSNDRLTANAPYALLNAVQAIGTGLAAQVGAKSTRGEIIFVDKALHSP